MNSYQANRLLTWTIRLNMAWMKHLRVCYEMEIKCYKLTFDWMHCRMRIDDQFIMEGKAWATYTLTNSPKGQYDNQNRLTKCLVSILI